MSKELKIIEVNEADAVSNNEVFDKDLLITFYNDTSKVKITDGKTKFNSLPSIGGAGDSLTGTVDQVFGWDLNGNPFAKSFNDFGQITASTFIGNLQGNATTSTTTTNWQNMEAQFGHLGDDMVEVLGRQRDDGKVMTFEAPALASFLNSVSPSSTIRAGVLQQTAIPDVTDVPTMAEYNNLLAKLRASGVLAT